jgi:FKBP-type peptidyl-prolyl cis-trans isomerase 2
LIGAGIAQKGRDYKPLTTALGEGLIIKQFKDTTIRMKKVEEKTVPLSPELA